MHKRSKNNCFPKNTINNVEISTLSLNLRETSFAGAEQWCRKEGKHHSLEPNSGIRTMGKNKEHNSVSLGKPLGLGKNYERYSLILGIKFLSAGSQSTEYKEALVNHLASSCSNSDMVPDLIVQMKQSMDK